MNDSKINPSTFLVILAFVTIYIVWGSTYFFILKALNGFPPMFMGAFRFIVAGLIMLVWSLLKRENIFILINIKRSAISGILMLFFGTGIIIWVEQYLASGLVAILVSAAPFCFVILDKPKWKENFTNRLTIFGLLIGFSGIILLFGEKISHAFSVQGSHVELGAMLMVLFGTLCWTAGSLFAKYYPPSGSNTVNVGWQMMAAGITFVPLSLLLKEPQNLLWQNIPMNAWYSILYLIFFGSIAAYTAYVWLLQVRPATQVSTYAYVNPVVAVMLSVFFASENISFWQICGLIIILGSVLLINLVRYRANSGKVVVK